MPCARLSAREIHVSAHTAPQPQYPFILSNNNNTQHRFVAPAAPSTFISIKRAAGTERTGGERTDRLVRAHARPRPANARRLRSGCGTGTACVHACRRTTGGARARTERNHDCHERGRESRWGACGAGRRAIRSARRPAPAPRRQAWAARTVAALRAVRAGRGRGSAGPAASW